MELADSCWEKLLLFNDLLEVCFSRDIITFLASCFADKFYAEEISSFFYRAIWPIFFISIYFTSSNFLSGIMSSYFADLYTELFTVWSISYV
jgi:hypothetical protein